MDAALSSDMVLPLLVGGAKFGAPIAFATYLFRIVSSAYKDSITQYQNLVVTTEQNNDLLRKRITELEKQVKQLLDQITESRFKELALYTKVQLLSVLQDETDRRNT